jgi:hypothetical protein
VVRGFQAATLGAGVRGQLGWLLDQTLADDDSFLFRDLVTPEARAHPSKRFRPAPAAAPAAAQRTRSRT